jgi:hypothetical protein
MDEEKLKELQIWLDSPNSGYGDKTRREIIEQSKPGLIHDQFVVELVACIPKKEG